MNQSRRAPHRCLPNTLEKLQQRFEHCRITAEGRCPKLLAAAIEPVALRKRAAQAHTIHLLDGAP